MSLHYNSAKTLNIQNASIPKASSNHSFVVAADYFSCFSNLFSDANILTLYNENIYMFVAISIVTC